jgi:hypothetical protein
MSYERASFVDIIRISTYKLCMKYCVCLTITNVASLPDFEVVSDNLKQWKYIDVLV